MTASEMLNRLLGPAVASQRVFRSAAKDLLFVFNYHEVSEEPSRFTRDFSLNVPPSTFARQLKWIKNHFNVLTPAQLLVGGFELPAALVTFDDGFRSVFTQAAPLLAAEGVPATVFMNMAPVHGEPFWSGVVTYLCRYSTEFREFIAAKYGRPIGPRFFLRCTRPDVEEFCALGRADVVAEASVHHGAFASGEDLARSETQGLYLGNHLYNHYNAAVLPVEELRRQYRLNDDAMANYRNRVRFFSYPFGQPVSCYNRNTDSELASLGAERIFTAFPLPNRRRDATRLHRISMFDYIDNEVAFRANCLLPAYVNEIRKRRYAYV